MNNENELFNQFLSVLVAHLNTVERCQDAVVCKDLAAFINSLPPGTAWAATLFDFIYEYGVESDYQYLGRDEQGEKDYCLRNPHTNWNDMINKELVALGFYKKYEKETV